MPAAGEFVYVQWEVATQYGDDGTITGHEYTPALGQLVDAGFAQYVAKPAAWPNGWTFNPWTGVMMPTNSMARPALLDGSEELPTYLLQSALDARYAPVVQTAVLTRDGSGRITSAVENGVTVTYARDTQGRIESETRNGKTTTYTRDGAGRVSGWATV